MKLYRRIIAALATVLAAVAITGCQDEPFKEVSDLALNRCLQPMNLNAKVSSALGDVVTFSWDVTKDAEHYILVVYSDAGMTKEYINETLDPGQIPYTIKMEADSNFWFKVQAISSTKKESKWAEYEKKIETFAVKDPLFLKVEARESTAITFKWSTDVADYKEVSHLAYAVAGSDDFKEVALSDDQINAASAVIEGLTPSTEYDVVLYFKSASRGEVDVWTMPDTTGTTDVATSAALEQAIKDGANIFLKMDGSPYTIAGGTDPGLDTSKGFKIYGEESADGTKPVILGAISIAPDFNGGDIYFEGVEFNGGNGASGHPICLKNGGTGSLVPVNSIIYKNCNIVGYSKGLIYEWNQTFKLGELTWDSCLINLINGDGQGGGDGIDFRGDSQCEVMNIFNNTITTGFRTFIRIDKGTWGKFNVEQNTMMNLCFSDNTNNAGIIAINKDNGTKVGEFTLKKNLMIHMQEKATLGSANAKYYSAGDMNVVSADNWYFNVPETFFNDNFPATGFTALGADPCYNAKGGYFNINPDSEIAGKEIGASKWWIAYVEEPEDLTLPLIEGAKTWNLGNAKYFSGTVKKSMVREQLMIVASENNPISFADGVMTFDNATVCNKKGVPQDSYVVFKVDKPGSVVIKPTGGDLYHVIVGVGPVSGSGITVKGGASTLVDADNPQKIIISDITEESLVYVYVSGGIGISELAWSNDVSQVNRALPAPAPKATPASFTAGESAAVTVKWDAIDNAGSYSVVFGGKTYAVEDGETSYVIEGKTTSMLDAGSYTVEVYANPDKNDIYNTASSAGVAAFAVLPKGGEQGSEFIVASVEEFNSALEAGKDAITFKYADTPYEVGAVELTAPLHLKGQTKDGKKTPINASFTLSGDLKGSVVLSGLEIAGSGVSLIIDNKSNAPVADTVAIYDSYIHGIKALYDNSGKATSNVQYVIFDGNIIEDSSTGADFIDMRAGAHHNFIFRNNTVANSCRTFVRTDAGHEMNRAMIRNNTFYKVATNESSKDNNGIFHIRSAGGAGLQDYRVQNNLFYSILIDTEPSNAAGFPKFRSKGGITPYNIANNYFYNCEDRAEKSAYSFWSYVTKEEGTAGGGAILPADPCKDAEKYDFTLTNAVAMNAGVGDPRWNPMGGGAPSSEITVKNAEEFATAISAGKQTITLDAGTYEIGTLEVVAPLNLIGKSGAVVKGNFTFKPVVTKFTASGITFDGAGEVSDLFTLAENTDMSTFSIKNCNVKDYKGRLFYINAAGVTVSALEFNGVMVTGSDGAAFTGGDFIDIRKGTVNALKVQNCTFANAVRTFTRIDASVVLGSALIANNTFYNLCFVDSKDNNGIFHIRASSLDESNFIVRKNIFAGMHRAVEAPSNANGYPKIVSTNTASKIPTFQGNYYWDFDTAEGFNFWTKDRVTEAVATAGNGVILTADPFKAAASCDFTLTNSLAASENVGDIRWNPNAGGKPGDTFEVGSVEELLTAYTAGKTDITLKAGTYDLTASTDASIAAGVWTLPAGVTLRGKAKDGLKPEIIGGFKPTMTEGGIEFIGLRLNGKNADESVKIGNMIDVDAAAVLSKLNLRDCEIYGYSNRLVSNSGASTIASSTLLGLLVHDFGTSGDFYDVRKGALGSLKITNCTFYNGIRTFIRIDKDVKCGAVSVKNNTFYNLCSVDSKDNNGIMHVRSTQATSDPRQIVVTKNIFAGMHKAAEAPGNANGFPKLVSTASETIAHPTITDNLFFDFDTTAPYSWWNTMTPESITEAGTVITETPFTGDPATGKFNLKAAYKGYGDSRW